MVKWIDRSDEFNTRIKNHSEYNLIKNVVKEQSEK